MSESKEKEAEEKRDQVDMSAIREVRSFVDDAGRRVHEFVPAFLPPEGTPEEPSFYKGEAMLIVNHPKAGEQQIRLEFMFEEATTVMDAFNQWDEVAEAEKKLWVKDQTKLMKEAEAEATKNAGKKKVIMPSKGSKKGILGADGKPLFK